MSGTACGLFNASPPTLVSKESKELQLDINANLYTREAFMPIAEDNGNGVMVIAWKPLSTSTYAPTLYRDFGTVTAANIKAGTGNVFSLTVRNANAAARFLQLHNKATIPLATEVPLLSFFLPASSGVVTIGSNFFPLSGINFTIGIGWAVSTTEGTFTNSATAAEHSLQITYL